MTVMPKAVACRPVPSVTLPPTCPTARLIGAPIVPTTATTATAPLHKLTSLAIAGALALGLTATVSIAVRAQDAAEASNISTVTGDLGTYLVDGAGATLYYFVPDPPGDSVCTDDCLAAWPALLVAEGQAPSGDETVTGTLNSALRDDGTSQATYRGRPLYYFAGDQAPGDTNGQGISDVWWVAAEDGSLVGGETPTAPELTLEAATTDLGTFITAADGRTAYFFSVDAAPGISQCAGDCLAAWPPVTVSADGGGVLAGADVPGVLGVITATDGSPQVTYDGRPLYYFAGDQAAGDTNGQDVGGVWFVARTDGSIGPS